MSRTIEVKDYEAFSNGVSTVNALQKSIESENTKITSSAEKLGSDTIFAGPISDSCQQGFEVLAKRLSLMMENMTTIADYLNKTKSSYESADNDAKDLYLSINKDGKLMMTESEKTAADNMANSIMANPTSAANQALIKALETEIGNNFKDYKGKFHHSDDWCAEWVSIKLQENGYNCDYSTVAGTETENLSILKAIKDGGGTIHYGPVAKGKTDSNYTPQAGDVFVIDTDGDGVANHTGIVVKDNGDGTLTTIEGNTMKEGQTEWIKNEGVVRERTDRKKEDIVAYGTPKKKS